MPALLCVRCITKTPPSHRHVARKGSFVASDTLEFCLRACALWWLPLLMTSVPAVATSGVQKNITIGVMLSMSGPKSLGVEARRAIELSFQRINDSPQYSAITDQDYVFQYLLDDVPCDPSDAFAAMLDIFSRSGEHLHGLAQDAFVGPSCDEVCQPGGRLARYYDVLMISYGCESSIFDDKEEFPTFGRTTPTFKDMEAFFAEVIAHYKWPRVTLVTMTTPVWQETLTEFESRIGSKSVQVMRLSLESVTFIRSQEFVEVLKNESERSRVFVLLMYSDAMLEFMRQADRAGLRDGRYAFLSVDYAGSSAHTGDLTFLDGLLDVTYDVRPETEEFQRFLKAILGPVSPRPNNTSCSNYEKGIHPLLVSDGIYAIAGAFNMSLSMGIPITRGALLANYSYGATFRGLVHDIELDEKGTRVAQFMLHNINNGCYVPIARTEPGGSGLTFLGNVPVWPGGSTTPPAGQDACGWYNERCQSDGDNVSIIIGSSVSAFLVLVTTVIGVFIYCLWRKNARHNRLLSTDWLQDWEDIKWRVVDPFYTLEHSASNYSIYRGSTCSLRSDVSAGTGQGSRHAGVTSYKCPVVRMDVEGVWTMKTIRRITVSLTDSVKRELNSVRALKHPNINAFMGACVKPGHVSLMWSYSPKGSLQDLLHSGIFKMELMFQLSFAQDIAKGLAYLQNSELQVHGRLKSSNIVVDSGLTCKLTDLDTPRFREGEMDLPETDPNFCSQHVWTAPERLREPGQPPTARHDMYSYGIVLYEIMLKRRPYVTEGHLRDGKEPDWRAVVTFIREPDRYQQHLLSNQGSPTIPGSSHVILEEEEEEGEERSGDDVSQQYNERAPLHGHGLPPASPAVTTSEFLKESSETPSITISGVTYHRENKNSDTNKSTQKCQRLNQRNSQVNPSTIAIDNSAKGQHFVPTLNGLQKQLQHHHQLKQQQQQQEQPFQHHEQQQQPLYLHQQLDQQQLIQSQQQLDQNTGNPETLSDEIERGSGRKSMPQLHRSRSDHARGETSAHCTPRHRTSIGPTGLVMPEINVSIADHVTSESKNDSGRGGKTTGEPFSNYVQIISGQEANPRRGDQMTTELCSSPGHDSLQGGLKSIPAWEEGSPAVTFRPCNTGPSSPRPRSSSAAAPVAGSALSAVPDRAVYKNRRSFGCHTASISPSPQQQQQHQQLYDSDNKHGSHPLSHLHARSSLRFHHCGSCTPPLRTQSGDQHCKHDHHQPNETMCSENHSKVLRPEIPHRLKNLALFTTRKASRDVISFGRRKSGEGSFRRWIDGGGTREPSQNGSQMMGVAGSQKDEMKSEEETESKMVELMQLCWAETPEARPTADVILKKLRGITSGRSLSDKIEQIMSRYSEQLEETVNERTRCLEEEKAKYFRVLCEVIPQKFVGSLVSGGRVEAESFSDVTIFFSDIVGFTSICGQCSPQEVLDFLNDLYTRFDVILNSYNVYKVETIGDAYMVAAGIPEPIPEHASQIALMALHLLSASVHVRAPWVDETGAKTTQCLKLRIGLNSGPVVAGIVGEKMPRFCLYGNTVNIASRMESNGLPLRIHMSKETANELEAIGGFNISYRGLISVKGKDQPVPTYWLLNSKLRPFDLPDWTEVNKG